MSAETELARAIVTLAATLEKEPPAVPHVVRLTEEEMKERIRQKNRRYYQQNRERFAERFRRNGANKRYYQRNQALKMEMNDFTRFVHRLEAEAAGKNDATDGGLNPL